MGGIVLVFLALVLAEGVEDAVDYPMQRGHARAPDPDVDLRRGVGVLNASNFDKVLAKYQAVLVMFYSPSCNYSKQMMPVYQKSAKKLQGTPMFLGKVDCIAQADMRRTHNISAYPTLLAYAGGQFFMEYEFYREEEDIITFMECVLTQNIFSLTNFRMFTMYKQRVRTLPLISSQQQDILLRVYPLPILPLLLLPYVILGCVADDGTKKKEAKADRAYYDTLDEPTKRQALNFKANQTVPAASDLTADQLKKVKAYKADIEEKDGKKKR